MSEENDQDMDRLVSDSDHPTEHTPVLATLVYETPMGGTITPIHPLGEEVVQEAPMGQTIIYNQDSVGETFTPKAQSNDLSVSASETLFNHEEAERFRAQWGEIQGGFVDEPRQAVEHADALVNEVLEKITRLLANERGSLENRWKQNNDVSTEELRQALQGYHAFFNRLLV
ncbi:MAG: hypothetical protein CVU44_06300 [Chloroflexi bacterium HGW-Chloroflexi-6]|nr:MAG: hypothetical protein CVU44_06300 [Chloroflexi bacterium HGW-Chloroflexi-6]